jgi:signal transduction histidine kinase
MARSGRDSTVAIDVHDRQLIDVDAHHRRMAIVDAAVPALVAAVIVVGEGLHGGADTHFESLVLGIGAAGTLVARRRWPGWTLAISGALVAVLFMVDPSAASVAVLAPAVALYSVGLRLGRRQQIAATIVAVAAVIGADLAQPGRPTLGQTLAHVLLIAVPLLAAGVIRTHQANLKLLVEQLDMAERARDQQLEQRVSQERFRIARELHDVVAHTLTEINVQSAAAAEQLEPGDARNTLEHIERSSHTAIGELRAIVGVLRGDDTTAAPRAPAPRLADITSLIDRARRSGLGIRVTTTGSPPDAPSDAFSLAAYRIVQESLTNARRHAPGTDVTVSLRFGPTCMSVVIDNPAAVSSNGTSAEPGVGIAGMRERAAALGGSVDARSSASGFRVRADLPYQPV